MLLKKKTLQVFCRMLFEYIILLNGCIYYIYICILYPIIGQPCGWTLEYLESLQQLLLTVVSQVLAWNGPWAPFVAHCIGARNGFNSGGGKGKRILPPKNALKIGQKAGGYLIDIFVSNILDIISMYIYIYQVLKEERMVKVC